MNRLKAIVQLQKYSFSGFISRTQMLRETHPRLKKQDEMYRTSYKIVKAADEEDLIKIKHKVDKLNRRVGKETVVEDEEILSTLKKINKNDRPLFGVNQALDQIVKNKRLVEIRLNFRTKKKGEFFNVRGLFDFPGGAPVAPRVCVFTSTDFYTLAKEAGADIIGDDETIEDIKKGTFDFTKMVATEDYLPILKPHGRILGPKGLMPSKKIGTLCKPDELQGIIKKIKAGVKEFKLDNNDAINIHIARCDIGKENVKLNIDSLIRAVMKTTDLSAKKLFKGVYLKAPLGRSFKIDLRTIDPTGPQYFMKV